MIARTQNTALCPSPETIRQYLDGWADETASQQIEQHLSHCDSCASSTDQDRSPSDQWLQAIRSNATPDSITAVTLGHEQKSDSIDPVARHAIELSKLLFQRERSSSLSSSNKSSVPAVTALGDLGPYEFVRPIGQGGMGYVMLARHKHLDKEVAVKILPSTPWRVPTEEARFQREVRAVGKLEHPAIVTALDAGQYDGTHFLAMEYVDGLDLSRLAKAIGPLAIADACELVRQTALGLSYAHAQGIVHRDIKPSNLMLDRTGKVKILDFGLAQLQPWDDGCADLTSVGQLMGTLDYMAPEQAEHGGAVSYRADLYSLGATLFRLLVGRAPLAITPTQTPIEKLRLLSHHPIPHLKTMLPDAPNELCAIVDSLLARDPSQRPPSAAHVAELIEPWSVGSDLISLLQKGQTVAVQSAESDSNAIHSSLLASKSVFIPPKAEPNIVPSTQSSHGRGHGNWIRWIATGLFAPLAALGGILIYFETQKGQIVVESEVNDIRVRVVADGKDVDDIQLSRGANSIRLQAGKYELHIDSPTDSITMSNNSFVLKKGETVVARVQRTNQTEPARIADVDLSRSDSRTDAPNLPVYGGKTLKEWLAILERERAFKEVFDSLDAILGLATKPDRDTIRKPLNEQIQRFKNRLEIVELALAIEKRMTDESDFGDRVIAILQGVDDRVIYQLLKNDTLMELVQNEHVYLKILMAFDPKKYVRETEMRVANELLNTLTALKNPSEVSDDQLRRYCDRIYRSEPNRWELMDPRARYTDAMQKVLDALVVRAIQSRDSSPEEKGTALYYLLNPASLTRVRKDAVSALHALLGAMSQDKELRAMRMPWTSNLVHFEVVSNSERRKQYEAFFGSDINKPNSISIVLLRFISATGLTAELAAPLRQLAKACMESMEPVDPELLALRFEWIELDSRNSLPHVCTWQTKPLAWAQDFFTFHATVRLLYSNKLAELKDFVSDAPIIDVSRWKLVSEYMNRSDSDRSGDLDKEEYTERDFAEIDKNGDGVITDVELYRLHNGK